MMLKLLTFAVVIFVVATSPSWAEEWEEADTRCSEILRVQPSPGVPISYECRFTVTCPEGFTPKIHPERNVPACHNNTFKRPANR